MISFEWNSKVVGNNKAAGFCVGFEHLINSCVDINLSRVVCPILKFTTKSWFVWCGESRGDRYRMAWFCNKSVILRIPVSMRKCPFCIVIFHWWLVKGHGSCCPGNVTWLCSPFVIIFISASSCLIIKFKSSTCFVNCSMLGLLSDDESESPGNEQARS